MQEQETDQLNTSTPVTEPAKDVIIKNDVWKLIAVGVFFAFLSLGLLSYMFFAFQDRLSTMPAMKQTEQTVEEPVIEEKVEEPVVQAPVAPPVSNCSTYKIYEGKFASEKCYTHQQLQDLQYYMSRYNSSIFDQNSAANTANTTCGGFSDAFKKLCDQAKEDYEDAKDDVEKYEGQIKDIIAEAK